MGVSFSFCDEEEKSMFGPLNLDVCSNIMKHEEFDILEFDKGV